MCIISCTPPLSVRILHIICKFATAKTGFTMNNNEDSGRPSGYRLKGTLRERIVEMIDVVSIGSYVDLDKTRELYSQAKVLLFPKGEKFIARYGFLFSSMYPSFENEEDDYDFRFDIYEDFPEEEQIPALREAGGEDSKMLSTVKSVAGCNITPVGVFGCGDCAIVYAGEDGKLYAIHEPHSKVDAYDSIVDLLETELRDHIPISLVD